MEAVIEQLKFQIELNGDEWSLDDFEAGNSLGEGGQGFVVLVRDVYLNVIFALKFSSSVKGNRGPAIVEAKLQLRLRHENILRAYKWFEDMENVYVLMEYAPGKSISDKIDESPKGLHEKTAASYFQGIVKALEYMHSNGLIHRDLKPCNVLVGADGKAKLADFGLTTNEAPPLFDFCGTLNFMAPEIMKRTEGYDHRVDIWALGIFLYQMLTGTALFGGNVTADVEAKVLDPEVPDLYRVKDPFARDLIHGLLEKDPTRRLTLAQVLTHAWVAKHFPK